MVDTPYPLPASNRQTGVLVATGAEVYGPFGDGWGIFDLADVRVETRPHADAPWAIAAVTIEKTDPIAEYGPFNVIFPYPYPASGVEYRVSGARTHRRDVAIVRGGAIDGKALEKELSKQTVVLQEMRRDVDGNRDEAFGSFLSYGADGLWDGQGRATRNFASSSEPGALALYSQVLALAALIGVGTATPGTVFPTKAHAAAAINDPLVQTIVTLGLTTGGDVEEPTVWKAAAAGPVSPVRFVDAGGTTWEIVNPRTVTQLGAKGGKANRAATNTAFNEGVALLGARGGGTLLVPTVAGDYWKNRTTQVPLKVSLQGLGRPYIEADVSVLNPGDTGQNCFDYLGDNRCDNVSGWCSNTMFQVAPDGGFQAMHSAGIPRVGAAGTGLDYQNIWVTNSHIHFRDEATALPDLTVRARVASGVLTSFVAGASAGGVVLALNDRILVTHLGVENGIRVVQASGAPTRAADHDTAQEIFEGGVIQVTAGTDAGKCYRCQARTLPTLGVTSLAFSAAYLNGHGAHYFGGVAFSGVEGCKFSGKMNFPLVEHAAGNFDPDQPSGTADQSWHPHHNTYRKNSTVNTGTNENGYRSSGGAFTLWERNSTTAQDAFEYFPFDLGGNYTLNFSPTLVGAGIVYLNNDILEGGAANYAYQYSANSNDGLVPTTPIWYGNDYGNRASVHIVGSIAHLTDPDSDALGIVISFADRAHVVDAHVSTASTTSLDYGMQFAAVNHVSIQGSSSRFRAGIRCRWADTVDVTDTTLIGNSWFESTVGVSIEGASWTGQLAQNLALGATEIVLQSAAGVAHKGGQIKHASGILEIDGCVTREDNPGDNNAQGDWALEVVDVGTHTMVPKQYVAGNEVTWQNRSWECILDHDSAATTEPGVGATHLTYWVALAGDVRLRIKPASFALASGTVVTFEEKVRSFTIKGGKIEGFNTNIRTSSTVELPHVVIDGVTETDCGTYGISLDDVGHATIIGTHHDRGGHRARFLVDRGAWAAGQTYAVGDSVTSLSSRYTCHTPHVSGVLDQPGLAPLLGDPTVWPDYWFEQQLDTRSINIQASCKRADVTGASGGLDNDVKYLVRADNGYPNTQLRGVAAQKSGTTAGAAVIYYPGAHQKRVMDLNPQPATVVSAFLPASTFFTTPTATAVWTLGQREESRDGAVYVYGQAPAGGIDTAGKMVVLPETHLAAMLDNAAQYGDRVAAASAIFTASYYGWFQVYGARNCFAKANAANNVELSTNATAGAVDDGAASGTRKIDGMILTTARGGSDGVIAAWLNHPHLGAANP